MIKKLLVILAVIGITLIISGCGDIPSNKVVTKDTIKEEIKVPEVMPQQIKDDCIQRFKMDCNQVHWKLCGGDHGSGDIKWVYTDRGLEVFKKYSCGFGMVTEYNMYGTVESKWWGFRK